MRSCLYRWQSTREVGTPSYELDRLQELGQSVGLGYQLARADMPSPRCRDAIRRECERRASLYDDALERCLGYLDDVRSRFGEAAAVVLERRYVDGASWKSLDLEFGKHKGWSCASAHRSLDWLDSQA